MSNKFAFDLASTNQHHGALRDFCPTRLVYREHKERGFVIESNKVGCLISNNLLKLMRDNPILALRLAKQNQNKIPPEYRSIVLEAAKTNMHLTKRGFSEDLTEMISEQVLNFRELYPELFLLVQVYNHLAVSPRESGSETVLPFVLRPELVLRNLLKNSSEEELKAALLPSQTAPYDVLASYYAEMKARRGAVANTYQEARAA